MRGVAVRRDSPPRQAPLTSRASRHRALGVLARLAIVVVTYQFYALARNLHGDGANPSSYETARQHGVTVSSWTNWLPIPSEARLQETFLEHTWLIKAIGAFYGSAHFLVTLAALLYLIWRRPRDLDRLGVVLMASTFAAVLCFALYPCAPPRMMPPEQGRTVDTLAEIGGVWSYDHGVLERISDPFAAMPSLHMVWAIWVSLVLWGSRRAWVRAAGVAHSVLTVIAVLLTGNHWYEDIAAGALLIGLVTLLVHRCSGDVLGRREPDAAVAADLEGLSPDRARPSPLAEV